MALHFSMSTCISDGLLLKLQKHPGPSNYFYICQFVYKNAEDQDCLFLHDQKEVEYVESYYPT